MEEVQGPNSASYVFVLAACADADGGGGGDGGGRFVQNMLYMRMQHGDVYVVQCLFEQILVSSVDFK